MLDSRIIRRYNAYYRGWCLAFGDHEANYEDTPDIKWLFGEDRIGLIVSSGLRKQAQRELLGNQSDIPELHLSDHMVKMNTFVYELKNDTEREHTMRLKQFLQDGQETHMFLTSHLFYPRMRIITFASEKPIAIMYKEMQPLKCIIE